MTLDFNDMGKRDKENAHFILKCALEMGIQLDGSGSLFTNYNNGETHLALEDYPFRLFMHPFKEPTRENVWIKWEDDNTDDEEEETLDKFNDLEAIYEWINTLEIESGI